MDPLGAGATLHWPTPPSAHRTRKDGARVSMNVAAHQEKEKTKKRENSRTISRRLRAALLRSIRGQHVEKMVCLRGVNWDPEEGQQPFRPNPNVVGDSTTLRLLLIGAVFYPAVFWCRLFFYLSGRVNRHKT